MKYIALLLPATVLIFLSGCRKNTLNNDKTNISVTLNFTPPEAVKITALKDVAITLVELNTSVKKEIALTDSYSTTAMITPGSYEIKVEGKVIYTIANKSIEGNIGAFVNKVDFLIDGSKQEIPLVLKAFGNDFIIEELFISGTLTPERKPYHGDQYIKLYNNTNQTLFADKLLIIQSKFQTTDKQDYTPNIMHEAFTADAIVQIPGNGTTYPVLPGQSIVIAVDGINHLENNQNSIDLSKAHFEIKDTDDDEDPDNTNVPNLINLYERMVINTQGMNSFAIARLPQNVSNDIFLKDYRYTYNWNFIFDGESYPSSEDAYKIPNTWIVDAVNLSRPSDFQWILTDASLDNGWTYLSQHQGDESRYGKAVRRKVLQKTADLIILQDTNNSSEDFLSRVKPSLQP